MTGVLVAISIPIFTAQLQKARLATNQANARAGYAAATADYLIHDASVSRQVDGSIIRYEYSVSEGKLTTVDMNYGSLAHLPTDISAWNTTDTNGGNLGKTTYKYWYIVLNSDGIISYYMCR